MHWISRKSPISKQIGTAFVAQITSGGVIFFFLPLFYTSRKVVTQKQHNLNAIANAETREFLHKFPRESLC